MKGKLIRNGEHPQSHEYKTIQVLIDAGLDVELIKPVQGNGIKTPDLTINGVLWEMKAPEGNGRKTIQNTIQRAGKQSENVIVDLQRCGIPEKQAISGFKYFFSMSKRLRRMKIINKQGEILDFSK